MPTIVDPGYPTMQNVTKRLAPNGSVESMIADTLTQENPMFEDIPWVEGNLATGHQITAVNALPSPTWRRLNQGIDPTKGETLQYVEACGLLEAHSKVDVEAANLGGNAAAYCASEAKMQIEGMANEFARALLYENVAINPERFHGLAPRFPATTGYTSSKYVKKSGAPASSNCQSIWIIGWDVNRVFGIYPKGSKVGISSEDLGKIMVRDANSKDFLAYASKYTLKSGIAVKDFRFIVRLQWDPSDTANNSTAAKTLYTDLETALGTLYKILPTTRIYWSRTSRNMVAAQLAQNNTHFLQYVQEGGRLIEEFLGVPCRITDSLVGETAIS